MAGAPSAGRGVVRDVTVTGRPLCGLAPVTEAYERPELPLSATAGQLEGRGMADGGTEGEDGELELPEPSGKVWFRQRLER